MLHACKGFLELATRGPPRHVSRVRVVREPIVEVPRVRDPVPVVTYESHERAHGSLVAFARFGVDVGVQQWRPERSVR